MTISEIKEQLKEEYGIEMSEFYVLPLHDLLLAKRKYHKVTRLINDDTGELWNVWVSRESWKQRKQ